MGQLVATIGAQPQRDQLLVVGELVEPRGRRATIATACGSVASVLRVSSVSKTRAPAANFACTSTTCRFTVGQQPLRQGTAHIVGTFDHPPTMRPLIPNVLQHQPISGAVSPETAGCQHRALVMPEPQGVHEAVPPRSSTELQLTK